MKIQETKRRKSYILSSLICSFFLMSGLSFSADAKKEIKTIAITQIVSHPSLNIEAIYIPNDNTIFSALPKLVQIANEHKLATFTSDPDSVKSGILAAYGYSQYEVGQTAGALAATILRGDNLGKLHVRSPEKADVYINKKTAALLGLTVPSEFHGNKVTIVE